MKLIVIGAGPKGIALHTKSAVLQHLKISNVPEIILIDKNNIAANWDGSGGFTDGEHKLGTSAEKDIGFPYRTEFENLPHHVNKTINYEMYKYSWDSFLIDSGKYCEWVDRGKPQPTHAKWANYLKWVWDATEKYIPNHNNQLKIAEVKKIETKGKKWNISIENGGIVEIVEGDGLILTGPGKPVYARLSAPLDPEKFPPLILDGQNYWYKKNINNLLTHVRSLSLPDNRPVKIGVLGGGETSASIINSLLEKLKGHDFLIYVLTRHISIFTRGESYHENFFYSWPDNIEKKWEDYDLKKREEFINRTDRGVFSPHSLIAINDSPNVEVFNLTENWQALISGDNKISVINGNEATPKKVELDCFIDASRFNPLSIFETIGNSIEEEIKTLVCNEIEKKVQDYQEEIKYLIEKDLSVRKLEPKLYLPMLSGLMQGPGFPNLSSLGLLSDRIIQPFL